MIKEKRNKAKEFVRQEKAGANAPLAHYLGARFFERTRNTPNAPGLPFVPMLNQRTAGQSAAFAQARIKPAVQRVPERGQLTPAQIRNTAGTQSLRARRGKYHMAWRSAEIEDFGQEHLIHNSKYNKAGQLRFATSTGPSFHVLSSADKYALRKPRQIIFAKR